MNIALRVLAGVGLFVGTVYLLLDSNVPDLLEGTNLDGSVSITWHSYIALAGLLLASEFLAFWVFRRRIAVMAFGGFAASIAIWMGLTQSRFAFTWEHLNALGIGPITWRTDLVLLGVLSLAQGTAFAVGGLVRRVLRVRAPDFSTPANHVD
ncbi:MAG TPA: hypothetical protein VMV57_10170 [Terracidiphilus sp.]|nr:hypothetical protein [Terracidiphilus sp.]